MHTGLVVDPISVGASSLAKAASSAVTKQLQSKSGVRLGSRDERRQVYDRFQAAAMEACAALLAVGLEQHLYTRWVGKRRWALTFQPRTAQRAAREGLHQLTRCQAEVLHAYLDLRLVANPAPLRAAEKVLERVTEMFDLQLSSTVEEKTAAMSRVVEAQRDFTDVCRDDLWYLPKRWQAYRPSWWSARRWRRRRST